LNHLFFADDSLIFCKAQEADWNSLTSILECYEKASGQRLNRDKTSIFFSRNSCPSAKECILQLSGIPATQRYEKYLGLPSLVGKSRICEFQNITDRVRKKLNDWKSIFLSQAGKEVLLKPVIQAIPTYSMSIFLLPKELCRELNSLMQKFWWRHKKNDRKIVWMSWEKMGVTKDKGGMGFRDLVAFNKALLAKQLWRLLQDPNSLASQILKAKYFPRVDLLEARLGSRPSYAWRSLLAARDLFKEGLFWRVGNGTAVKIWGDKWIPRPTSFTVQSPCRILEENATVNQLIDAGSGEWNKALVQEVFVEQEAGIICNIPISRYQNGDKLIWRATPTGTFTVRSAYHLEVERRSTAMGEGSQPSQDTKFWKFLWSLGIPNSTKVFVWRACREILPTKVNLKKRKVITDDTCFLCQNMQETTTHALWGCPASTDVWGASIRTFQKYGAVEVSFRDLFEGMMKRCSREEMELFAVLAKNIWTRRNHVLHGGEFHHPTRLAQEAMESLK
jgi:hypothetical protein